MWPAKATFRFSDGWQLKFSLSKLICPISRLSTETLNLAVATWTSQLNLVLIETDIKLKFLGDSKSKLLVPTEFARCWWTPSDQLWLSNVHWLHSLWSYSRDSRPFLLEGFHLWSFAIWISIWSLKYLELIFIQFVVLHQKRVELIFQMLKIWSLRIWNAL